MRKEHPPSSYEEDDLLPISALADLVFCERRAALHHLEGIWNDNVFTVEGTFLHKRVDNTGTEVRGVVRIARGLRLRSFRLGLSGRADAVEFHRIPTDDLLVDKRCGIPLGEIDGLWRPFPAEYKRGRLRFEQGYEVQLCAQAICLEEMLGVDIPAGALFYGSTRRRKEVAFDPPLRVRTEEAAMRLHCLLQEGRTPPAFYEKKCDSCSLINLCLPKTASRSTSAAEYMERMCNR